MAMKRACDNCLYGDESDTDEDAIRCDCEDSDYYGTDVDALFRCDCYEEG